MKKLVLAAVLALLPGAALAADISGAWNVAGAFDSMGIKFNSACTLAQDSAGKVTGTCQGTQQESAATTGAVTTGADGKTAVEFAYDTSYQGSPVHLDFKGQVQADGTMSGAVDAGGISGTFTAAKGAAAAAAPAAPAAK
jgi:hypothetical protein